MRNWHMEQYEYQKDTFKVLSCFAEDQGFKCLKACSLDSSILVARNSLCSRDGAYAGH